MSTCSTGMIVAASVLAPVTLVLLTVAFGTDHWLELHVDRGRLTAADTEPTHDLYSHTRYRGLFRQCYFANDTSFLNREKDVVDGHCFNFVYNWPDQSSDRTHNYRVRMHLVRLFLAFYIICLVFFIGSFVFGLILCCWRTARWAYFAALLAFIAAFSMAGGLAFFHGAEYMERNKVHEHGFYSMWPYNIKDATTRTYGWSYVLGWVGMVLAALTATAYTLAGCYLTGHIYQDRVIIDKDNHHNHSHNHNHSHSHNHNNRSRDNNNTIAMEPVYALEDPYLVKPETRLAAAYNTAALAQPFVYSGPYMLAESPRLAVTAEPVTTRDKATR